MNEYKLCPFCGSDTRSAVELRRMGSGDNQIAFSIICKKCGIAKEVKLSFPNYATFEDVMTAIRTVENEWNMRAEQDSASQT